MNPMLHRALATFMLAGCAVLAAADESESVRPLLRQPISNLPGRTFTSAIVSFGPGVRAAPHTHGEAFVYAYVLQGEIRSQLDDQPAKVYRVGDSWFEPPGADHKLTENASASEPAQLLVVFVAPNGAPLKYLEKPH